MHEINRGHSGCLRYTYFRIFYMVCCCFLLQDLLQSCSRGGREWRTCAMRYDERRRRRRRRTAMDASD